MPPTDWPVLRVLTVIGLVALGAASLCIRPAAAGPMYVDYQVWQRTGVIGPGTTQSETLYVSSAGGQEQARTFVDLDVAGLQLSQLNAGSLVLGERTGSGLLPERATLRACGLVSHLDHDGEWTGEPPEVDCEVATSPSRASDGTWDIPLRAFAAAFAARRISGVTVLPAPAIPGVDAFTVAFDVTRTQIALPLAPAHRAPAGSTSTEGQSADASREGAAAPTLSPPLSRPVDSVTGMGLPPLLASDKPTGQLGAVAATGESNSATSILLIGLVVALAALVLLVRAPIYVPAVSLPGGVRVPSVRLYMPPRAAARLLPWVVVPGLVMLLPETAAYKIGLIAIVFVGAIGLHVLVNTAGELSLAHAAFVGIPAFAVAQASSRADISPILAVPFGVAAGIAIGLVVAATALRARGLQVALVTLAVAIGTVQFLFFQGWLIGPPEGLAVPVPSVFGLPLDTNISRVPVLGAMVALATAAGTAIIRSKLGRGLLLLRTHPDVAAAAAVPVSLYRAMAYAIAGGFAGLAGSCYVIWVQTVSPQAFPLRLGFTYLLIAALAGRGGLGGVAISAAIVQGGSLFTFLPRSFVLYVAPVALILQVTRFEGGINAALGRLRLLLAGSQALRGKKPLTTTPVGASA